MFKGRIISRSHVNGKVHTFQKDFDDYDQYQEFIGNHPEYNVVDSFQPLWNPWRVLDRFVLPSGTEELPVDTKYLPEGMDLSKYETRRREKREQAVMRAERRRSLLATKDYLEGYLSEVDNKDDAEAKADLETIEKELKTLE